MIPYKVVNDPESENFPEPIFVRSDPSPQPGEAFVFDSFETIKTPDFLVLMCTYNNEVQKTAFDNYDPVDTHVIENPDITKASDHLKKCIENDVPFGYILRFNCSTSATATSEYTFANGHVASLSSELTDLTCQLYDNIPVSTLFKSDTNGPSETLPSMRFNTNGANNHSAVIYEPYNRDMRWNVDYHRENNLLYKFDIHKIAAFETANTTIFSNSTQSHLHVIKGMAFVDASIVNTYEFWKHDATQQISITAGPEGAIVVQMSKVSEIILP